MERIVTNATAIEETIAALEELGRIERVDAALVAIARTLAMAVDDDPSNASLFEQYRRAELALREVGRDDDSGVDTFWDRLQSEIRDAENAGQEDSGA